MARAGAVLEIDRGDPPDLGELLRKRPPPSDCRPLAERSPRRDEALLERSRRPPVERRMKLGAAHPIVEAGGKETTLQEFGTVAAIYRYPVKGLSAEASGPGRAHARRMPAAGPAVCHCARHDARSTRERPNWLPKTHFVMLMRDESLARLHTRLDADKRPSLDHAGGSGAAQRADRRARGGRRSASSWRISSAGTVEGPLRVVEAQGHAFADARRKPNATTDKYVSLINLGSIAPRNVDRGRSRPAPFPGKCVFRRRTAWSELGWVGSEISIGSARLRIIAADHPVRRDPSQPADGRAGSRHRRHTAALLRAQSDGRLRGGGRSRQHRNRRCSFDQRCRQSGKFQLTTLQLPQSRCIVTSVAAVSELRIFDEGIG